MAGVQDYGELARQLAQRRVDYGMTAILLLLGIAHYNDGQVGPARSSRRVKS